MGKDRIFRVVIDGRFMAENIDDALERLGRHFLAAGEDPGINEGNDLFLPNSKVEIGPEPIGDEPVGLREI